MKASQIRAVLIANQSDPIMIWGPPGVGKSDLIRQVAEETGRKVFDKRMALMDPTDWRGIPTVDGDKARWLQPSDLPQEEDGPTILFLDEINAAPPLVQASAYQLILDRAIGEYKLPDNVQIIAAGNRRQDRAVTHRMPAPLRSRFLTHIEFELSVEDWIRWAQGKTLSPDIVSFIEKQYGTEATEGRADWPLFDFSQVSKDESFPTPRTWTYVAKIYDSIKEDLEGTRHELIQGTIGAATAEMFRAFVTTLKDLPDVSVVLKDGETPELPRMDIRYAFIRRVSAAVSPDKQELNNVINYAKVLSPEYGVLLIKAIIDRKGEVLDALQTADGFNEWAMEHAEIIV